MKKKSRKASRSSKKSKVEKLIRLSRLGKHGRAMAVVKANGKQEPFSSGKLLKSISKAMGDAKLTDKKAKVMAREICNHVAGRLKGKKDVHSSDLRKIVLAKLDKKAKKVSVAWKLFEKEKC